MLQSIKILQKGIILEVTTVHKFIDKYPIRLDDKSLILGTIHPHMLENFKVDFFYGNKNSLWDILGHAKNIQLTTLTDITNFLLKNKISISDLVLQCNRKHSGITSDKDLYKLILNKKIKDEILNSNIETIYFTSAFGKNNAATLFFDMFELEIPQNWKNTYEMNINFFGKKIKCVILLSPSGASNMGISKSKIYLNNKDKYTTFKTPVKQFKIDFYKEKFE